MKRFVKLAFRVMALTALAAAARADNYDAEADERKADWLFMQALEQKFAGNDDAHLALMNRALELTPDKTGREAYEAGVRNLLIAGYQGDSVAFSQALELCDGYFRAHPSDSYAGAYIARVYADIKQPDRAIEIYETLEKHRPNSTALVANHAELLLNIERFDEAIGLYRQLEKSLGRSPMLTQRISNIYLWKQDTVAAMAEVESYIAENPKNIEALHLGAAAATKFGNTRRALDFLEKAKKLDPTNGNTYYYAADAYRKLGMRKEYDEAIVGAVGGTELERDAKVELVRYYLSEELDSIAASDKAEAVLGLLVKQYPRDYQIRVIMMSYYASNSLWLQAAEQMAEAIAADPGNPDDFMTLSRLYYTAEEKQQAIETLNRGIAQHPAYPDLYSLLGGLYTLQEQYDSAAATLSRALEIETLTPAERSDLLRDFGDLIQKAPELGTPDDYYDRALAENPDNDLAMNNYAYYLADGKEGGDLLKAKEMIAKAVIYNPGSSTYYDTYAWVLFRLGDLQGAKRYIDLAITSDRSVEEGDESSLAEVLLHAGDIYNAIGQRDKAINYWKRVAELDNEELAQKAQQRLSQE